MFAKIIGKLNNSAILLAFLIGCGSKPLSDPDKPPAIRSIKPVETLDIPKFCYREVLPGIIILDTIELCTMIGGTCECTGEIVNGQCSAMMLCFVPNKCEQYVGDTSTLCPSDKVFAIVCSAPILNPDVGQCVSVGQSGAEVNVIWCC